MLVRQLKDYSMDDNIDYLKSEYKPIYVFLKDLTKSVIRLYDTYYENMDDQYLDKTINYMKLTMGQALFLQFQNQKMILSLKREGNLGPLGEIFEFMLFDKLDQYYFNQLDPEIQALHKEAEELL